MIRDKALSLCSPVISASDPGNRSVLKGFSGACQVPRQLCDILLLIEGDLPVVCILLYSCFAKFFIQKTYLYFLIITQFSLNLSYTSSLSCLIYNYACLALTSFKML